jgi:hypothetical protein
VSLNASGIIGLFAAVMNLSTNPIYAPPAPRY